MKASKTNLLTHFFDEEIYLIDQKVEVKKEQMDKPLQAEEKLKVKDVKNHELMIVVHDSNYEFTDPDSMELLKKILNAVKVDINSACCINTASSPASYFRENIAAKTLLFGVDKNSFPIVTSDYSIIHTNEGIILWADRLIDLGENVDLKKKLWNCLKEAFA